MLNAAKPGVKGASNVAISSLSLSNVRPNQNAPARSSAQAQEAPAAGSDTVSLGSKPAKKDWTVLCYVASDTNLYQYQMNNIKDAETVGTTAQMNVVAELSHAPQGGGVQRTEIGQGHSDVKQDLGSRDMGSPQELADFIKWGKENYPANHYMLILNDHGNGWQGCCQDESHDGWLTLPKLEQGLKDARTATDGKALDIVGFDACLMANIETADQLKNEANYLVGSEETEGGAGWNYNTVLNSKMLDAANVQLRSRDGLTPESLAKTSVKMAAAHQGDLPTMSAFDTSKSGAVVQAAKNLGAAIEASGVPAAQFAGVASQTQKFAMERDLYDFSDRLQKQFSSVDPNLGNAAGAMKDNIKSALIAEEHSSRYPNAHGLTIELSKNFDSYGFRVNPDPDLEKISFDRYQNTEFAKDTGWDKTVAHIYSGGSAPTPPPAEHAGCGSALG